MKVKLDAIGQTTTLESNKSHRSLPVISCRTMSSPHKV
jgi:hypothetical protein